MRKVILYLLSLIALGCSEKKDCTNCFDFLNCDENIPIIKIDYSKRADSLRMDVQAGFENDLCDLCSWAYFKMPFNIENKTGFIKVMADFGSPFCEDCPVPIRLRYYFTILVNKNRQLLVEGKLMHIDSLKKSIIEYFNNVGNPEGFFPETYDQVNFCLNWDRQTDKTEIDKILTVILNAQLDFVKSKVVENGGVFCNLTKNELVDIKQKYPLRIEFDLGKIKLMKPKNIKILELETPQVIEEIDFKEEI